MFEYWDSLFKEGGALWEYKPSDSAIRALDIFKSNEINKILIPGAGYGRNAKLFFDNGFDVTGIEISESAIKLAKACGLNYMVHHGSVTSMPFDNDKFEGVFCYALIHLLNKRERRTFLKSCYNQLKTNGLMIFMVVSKKASMYGDGKPLSKDRFRLKKGLNVYFYDLDSVKMEFTDFGLIECKDMDEPIKFITGQEPLKCIWVVCKKEISLV